MNVAQLSTTFAQHESRFIAEWGELLAFQSVSTDPTYDGDCVRCAEWLVRHLTAIGLRSRLLSTSSKPVVFAEHIGRPGAPTVLFYGHYDVQPVDPVELWTSPPFQATLRNGRLYARGAEDNKGQLFYVIKAIESLIAAQSLDCTVRIFLEGEEESGSDGIAGAMRSWPELKGDVLMVCDTGTPKPGTVAITMGLRGIVKLTARLTGPTKDLHSGVHGGIAPNPATQMARLVASLHDERGRIAVAGYYDGVAPIAPEDKELANIELFTPAQYVGMVGVPPVGGETDYTLAERRGFRPTIEINGIHSGYDGPGSKTIIPSSAMVKITSRIVGGQEPERCLGLLVDHLKRHTPAGLTLEISEEGVGGPALLLSSRSPLIQKAREVIASITDQPVVCIWEGASIPIVAELAAVSGAEPLLVGFATEEDNIHAPNESFSIAQFRDGYLYAAAMLQALGHGTGK
jgi:acetylornithine deacetylase/succinyl-diaminopimelate desuccinylase-like protein